jgi:hypothetical protein
MNDEQWLNEYLARAKELKESGRVHAALLMEHMASKIVELEGTITRLKGIIKENEAVIRCKLRTDAVPVPCSHMKLCVGCKHFDCAEYLTDKYLFCKHPNLMEFDLIMGKMSHTECSKGRRAGACGPEGKFFEKR